MNKKNRLKIIFEDKNIIVVEKEAGLLTIGTEKERERTLYHEVLNYLKKKNQKVFIVHRLDKDTSGLIVFAKSLKAKTILQDNWDKVIRKYYAIVYGNTKDNDTIKIKLSENKAFKSFIDDKFGKLAITHYKKIKEKGKYTLLDIDIITGRKNQIRVSMDYINAPIIGDKKYGDAPNPLRRLCLHAYYLEFINPITKEKLVLETSIPKSFNNLID